MRLIDADALIHEYYKNPTYQNLCNAINSAPTVEPMQWIPCSERLPELKEWVLVSSGDCVVSDCLVERDGNKIWYECGRIDIEHDAWMPLPEPYKEADNDD